ncbi:hypothetical protein POM88_030027 [Heracleum sosnowskyi]|uniref:Uncharacterized protein n=1 Tax=Heracleum sosnowskyi TaxID=360622 RepID=A0AAD8MIB4_9APIA|nr:hypothetical protein POM88_030027 [Heracleum sosnowskyi]
MPNLTARHTGFSEHSKGQWVSAPQLEFENGNKPVTYSSLNGHAFYPKPGLVLQGSGGIGIRNDTAKSKNVMDTGFKIISFYLPFLSFVCVLVSVCDLRIL